MKAKEALGEVEDALNDRASFMESFDPEDRADDVGNDRLTNYRDDEALRVLAGIIRAAADVVSFDRELTGVWGPVTNIDERCEGINALARALGERAVYVTDDE